MTFSNQQSNTSIQQKTDGCSKDAKYDINSKKNIGLIIKMTFSNQQSTKYIQQKKYGFSKGAKYDIKSK